jgi:DNA-binding transcriptional regulator LsrR (DeoR family)
MPRRLDPMLLYEVACRYYRDGMSQDDIGAIVGLSRSQISRVLDQARRLGIVHIELRIPENVDTTAMEQELARRLGLTKVWISHIERPGGLKSDQGRIDLVRAETLRGDTLRSESMHRETAANQALAAFACQILPSLMHEGSVVGLGWGRTIYETALRLPVMESVPGQRMVPLIGSAGQQAPWLQINGIVDRFAERTGAEPAFIRTQAFPELGPALRSRLETENLQRISSLWEKVDLAIIGLGKAADHADYLEGEMDADAVRTLAAMHTVGDILGRFFGQHGVPAEPGAGWNPVSMELARLGSIQKVLCIACGLQKTEGIAAAARAGYFHSLITDAETAVALLGRSETP